MVLLVCDAFICLEHKLCNIYRMTTGMIPCLNVEVAVVIKRNIAMPLSKNGQTSDADMLLPYNKTITIGRNESSFRSVCGNEFVDRINKDTHGSTWFFDEHREYSYSDDVTSKHEQLGNRFN